MHAYVRIASKRPLRDHVSPLNFSDEKTVQTNPHRREKVSDAGKKLKIKHVSFFFSKQPCEVKAIYSILTKHRRKTKIVTFK